jgi:peptidoglycan hydrolase CwlO-like protein
MQGQEVNLNTLLEVIDAAKEDGQNMEIALKRKNEKIEELEKKLGVTEKELEGTKEELKETKWNLKQAENDYNRPERERFDMGF